MMTLVRASSVAAADDERARSGSFGEPGVAVIVAVEDSEGGAPETTAAARAAEAAPTPPFAELLSVLSSEGPAEAKDECPINVPVPHLKKAFLETTHELPGL